MQESQETCVQFLGWEDPCWMAWQSIPVFLPGESHGQNSLAGWSPQDHKELDMTQETQHAHKLFFQLTNFVADLTFYLTSRKPRYNKNAYVYDPKDMSVLIKPTKLYSEKFSSSSWGDHGKDT